MIPGRTLRTLLPQMRGSKPSDSRRHPADIAGPLMGWGPLADFRRTGHLLQATGSRYSIGRRSGRSSRGAVAFPSWLVGGWVGWIDYSIAGLSCCHPRIIRAACCTCGQKLHLVRKEGVFISGTLPPTLSRGGVEGIIVLYTMCGLHIQIKKKEGACKVLYLLYSTQLT